MLASSVRRGCARCWRRHSLSRGLSVVQPDCVHQPSGIAAGSVWRLLHPMPRVQCDTAGLVQDCVKVRCVLEPGDAAGSNRLQAGRQKVRQRARPTTQLRQQAAGSVGSRQGGAGPRCRAACVHMTLQARPSPNAALSCLFSVLPLCAALAHNAFCLATPAVPSSPLNRPTPCCPPPCCADAIGFAVPDPSATQTIAELICSGDPNTVGKQLW